jgi:integrase
MAEEHHELMGGKLHVYRRENSSNWQCSTFLEGKNWRVSTKEDSLSLAKEFAEDWYLGLRGKSRAGQLKVGKTFKHAAERFIDEFEVITQGQRSPIYVKGHKDRLKNHLIPFFGDTIVTDITPGLVQDYRIHRMKTGKARSVQMSAATKGEEKHKPPARSTLHQEIVCLRQVLKTAQRHGWLPFLPDISPPYKSSGKVTHRAWFSPEEYKRLRDASRDRTKHPKKERWRTACENLHDYILIMVNTGLRPDEALRLEFRDVAIVTDEATGERILEIEVRGKRGVGFCKSMPGAVLPFERLQKRNNGKPTERLFPKFQRELFNTLLDELELKTDRDGQSRTAYSLRHTYICMRLMEGADIYQVAKNCRTSVEMIETYYASHIKNTLDASAINVMKPKKGKKGRKPLKKDEDDDE